MNNNRLKFISLFSGAGGFDLGLRKAGFTPVLSIEKDKTCQKTLILNDPKIHLSNDGDIFDLSSSQILKQSGVTKRCLDLLVGGPPCQPFSKSSYWVNSSNERMNDPRALCVREFMRVVDDVLPKVVVIENVTGLGYASKGDGLEYIKTRFQEINQFNKTKYNPVVLNINAADYGVPQIRKRLFIVASINGTEFELPEPKFCNETEAKEGRLSKYRTAWDAIGDLDTDISSANLDLKGKWADLLPSIPEGQNYLWHTNRMEGLPLFGWRTRYWSFLLKLSKNKPSWTITASPGPAIGPFHWRNRKLSIRELARLQTYPDDYEFCGSYSEQQRQIGNSVPPAIGELIGLEIRRQFFKKRVRRTLRLIPDENLKSHRAYPIRSVPSKYLELIDEHEEHPGVGKGPGAKNSNLIANVF